MGVMGRDDARVLSSLGRWDLPEAIYHLSDLRQDSSSLTLNDRCVCVKLFAHPFQRFSRMFTSCS